MASHFLRLVLLSLALVLVASIEDEITQLPLQSSSNPALPHPSSESSASLPTSSSSSSSSGHSPTLAGGVTEDEVRTGGSDVRLLNGHKGGKLLIFENKNGLVKVDVPRVHMDQRIAQEQNKKQLREEMRKKDVGDERADARENRIKNDRRERQQREATLEHANKQYVVEQTIKQTTEAEIKGKISSQEKEDAFKAQALKVAESNAKTIVTQQEQGVKNSQEQDKKAADKIAEQKKKTMEEQTVKQSQITFLSPWRNYGAEYGNCFAMVHNDICYFTGLAAGESGQIGTAPSACAPGQGRLIFNVMKGGINSRVDILQDGRIFHIAGGWGGWMTMNSIYYPTSIDRPVGLQSGWHNYGYEYRPTTVRIRDDICFFSGLIAGSAWNLMFQIPAECNPDARLIFSANNHESVSRLDVLTNGNVYWVYGTQNYNWVNLDGIAFKQSGGADLQLINNWSNYGGEYRPARWNKSGRTCVISGLIRSNDWQVTIAVLPQDCRPSKRLIFGNNSNSRDVRVDIQPNGEIQYISGKINFDFISLNSITFLVDDH